MPFIVPIAAGIAAASAVSTAVAAGTALTIGSAVASVAGLGATIAGAVTGNKTLEEIGAIGAAGGAAVAGLAAPAAAAGGAVTTGGVGISGLGAGSANVGGGALTSAVSGTLGEIGSAVSKISGVAQIAIAPAAGAPGSLTSVFSSIGHVVDEVSNTVSTFIKPIATVVGDVATLVQTINDKLILPVKNLVVGVSTGVNDLVYAFQHDLGHGLAGLAQLPTDLSNALTSTSAIFNRSMQQLGEINGLLATQVFGPAIVNAARPGLDALGNTIAGALAPQAFTPDDFTPETFSTPEGFQGFMDFYKQYIAALPTDAGFFEKLGHFLIGWETSVASLAMSLKPAIAYAEQFTNLHQPTRLVDPGDTIDAAYRGILEPSSANEELGKQGYSPDRITALMALKEFLVGPREAVSWAARGIISEAERDKLLAQNAFRSDTIQPFVEAMTAPVNPESLIRGTARGDVAGEGFLATSLGQGAPADVTALFRANLLSENQADLSWRNHWAIPGMGWWIQAYFRNIRTRTEVDLAAQALNIPEEVINDLIDVERPLIQLWMVPDIIATGAMTQVEAMAYMGRMGFNEADATIMVNYGLSKAGSAVSAQYADLAKVNITNSTALYEAGAITRQDLINIYLAHKYTQAAAELTVEAVDLKAEAAARKQVVADLEARVSLGDITATEAISQGYKEGLTDVEIAAMVKSFGTNKVAQQKLPTEAQLLKMVKEGLIQATDYVAGLELLGYNQTWAALIAESELGLPKGSLPGG